MAKLLLLAAAIVCAACGGGKGKHPTAGDAPAPPGVIPMPCTTTFQYVPPPGRPATVVGVTGEWNGFADPGTPMTGPDASGAFSAQVIVTPGLVAYNFIVDGTTTLDPNAHWQKYVGGTATSAVQVATCSLPKLSVVTNTVMRPTTGQGHYFATVAFTPGLGAPALDPTSVQVTLRKDGVTQSVTGATADAAHSTIAIDIPALADGKYSAFVTANDLAGQAPAEPLRLVFWVEANAFTWQDAVIEMVMTDRFKDGDATNDPAPTTQDGAGHAVTVDPREDYHGGDFAGVTAKINDGTFDALGITTLWLSPFNTNPSDAWLAADNVHSLTGYHGYWPIRARAIDPRFGTADDLHAMVTAAHAHGIRVIQDLEIQHVHQEHEYLAAHPDWFNTTGCICGTSNCDLATHRLDCRAAAYLPNIDWTSTAGAAQWEADAIWWLDAFDLDGVRLDDVLQVPDLAVINLVSAVRGEFEASGTKVFMTGETATGWVDNTLADNLSQYQTVSQYIDPDGLDGQLDFTLYYAVPQNVFATQSYGMDHADYWVQASGSQYPHGALMSPFIGSRDTARFITLASYRGQSPALDPSIPYNQWSNVAGPPPDAETYGRQRAALTWLMTLPGAPVLYYGDEYGEYGGVEPNNRVNWRGDGSLGADETATLTWTRKLGAARRALPALRRGAYVPVYNTDANTLVFARQDAAGDIALVASSRLDTATTITTALPSSLAISDGTTLHDRLGGPDVVVSGGMVSVTLGAQGAAILAP